MKAARYILIVSLLLISSIGYTQSRIDDLRNQLEVLSIDMPGLKESVEISLEGVELQQFLRGLGINHKLNLNVEAGLNEKVVNNFADAEVADVLIFLCQEYDLEMDFIGSIISVKRLIKPEPAPEPVILTLPEISYVPRTDFLSLDLKNDTLSKVAKEITSQTLKNVILSPGLKDDLVSVYIQNRPFDAAIEKLAFANGLTVRKEEGDFYVIERDPNRASQPAANPRANSDNQRGSTRTERSNAKNDVFEITVVEGKVSVNAQQVPIAEIIQEVSRQANTNYYLYSQPEGETDMYFENASYDDFLDYILSGTTFTYKKDEEVYLIGEAATDVLRTTEILRMENRTVEKISEVIPADIAEGLTIAEFLDLNALIVTGSFKKINQLEDLVRQLDQPVPTVLIEVMIVDYNKSRSVSTGISAGIGEPPANTTGTIVPDANINLSSESINNLINSFNGFGLLNLGNVTDKFYLNIQALETEGVLRTRSTPKLSTLNGHEASLSIGSTEYYLEVTNRYVGTENPSLETQQNYKSVNADLSINIKPTVSGNDEVTLEIAVQQSDFTERINETAPPGSVTRNFDSKVRIKNGDMILLGGLERRSNNKSGSGLPLLARIPVIRWFFGKRTVGKEKSKLNIFIRSTVIH